MAGTDGNNIRVAGSARVAEWSDTTLTRRQLLLLGSAGAASAFLSGLRQTGPVDLSPLLNFGARVTEPFSIGFWDVDSNDEASRAIVGASTLTSGDSRFLTDGARVSVYGMYPFDTPEAISHYEAINVDVSYAPHHDLAFRAFSLVNDVNGAAPFVTAPVAVSVPVDAVDGMTLNVSYRVAGARETTQAALRFTTGADANIAKLREGVYLVALPDAGRVLPDWRSQRVSANGGMRGISRRDWNLESRSAARTPYIMLSVK